jgi:hypothetical protein
VAGYCILAAYLVCRGGEALVSHGRSALRVVILFASILIATGLATLLNPYGLDLHRWLIQSLGAPRPEIIEWRAPELFSVAWIPWWCLIVFSLLALGWCRTPRDVTHVVLLALTLFQACAHRRHIPFYAILFGCWMPVHVESLLCRLRGNRRQASLGTTMSAGTRRVFAALLCVACLITLGSLYGQVRQLRVKRSLYPTSAFQYIADQNLRGRLVVRLLWAQYAIAAFGQQPGDAGILVAFDGRFRTCYPQNVVDMFFDFVMGTGPPGSRHRNPDSPPPDASRILQVGHPDLVLIGRKEAHAVQTVMSLGDTWVLLYQDGLSQLWGRASKYDDAQHPDYIPPSQRQISDQPQDGIVAWPALPVRQRVDVTRARG